ncbi:DegT/DnrJ/EryC1/StrS family aminotransferase [Verrucomicrobiota bacterium]
MKQKIPFNDLKLNYASIKDEIDTAIQSVVETQRFIGGDEITAFENEFAAFCGKQASVSCSNGTDALMLSLKTLGVGPGDEVVVPAMTFVATAEAVVQVGASPVFADVEEGRGTLDVDNLARFLTPATKAVIVVHLYGQIADMEPIAEFCRERKLYLVEDAAQAHGAEMNGKKVGSWGDFTAFSFFPGKNLGAFGDAGAIIGKQAEQVQQASMLKDHGRKQKYLHERVGYNCRCDALQAAILRVKLRYLPEWTRKRQAKAARYLKELKPDGRFALPLVPAGSSPVWHLFTLRTEKRDALKQYLEEQNISTGIHYPYALHQQPAFAKAGVNVELPISERIAGTTLSLPIFPEITDEQIEHVVEALNKWPG